MTEVHQGVAVDRRDTGSYLWTGFQHEAGMEACPAVVQAPTAGQLTTPHKLRPQARSRKRASRRQGVCGLRKPTAEAVTLHAVVRLQLRRYSGNRVGAMAVQPEALDRK